MHAAANPKAWPNQSRDEAIRRRARELYEQRGRVAGHELEDWLQAEAEIDGAAAAQRKSAVVVKVDGVTYTGEYDPAVSQGYCPGEWSAGERMPVRFEGDRMYLKRKNGSELEARIVKKTGGE